MNPFVLSPHTPPQYFCDRRVETEAIISYLENGSDVTLISPRRYGKTGLIYHIFDVLKQQNKGFDTYYVDIYSSRSMDNMLSLMAESIYRNIDGKKAVASFLDILKSVRPVVTPDPISGTLQFSFTYQTETEKRYTLKSMLDYLEGQKNKVIVAIDEFQQIRTYEGINAEALLRTYIQPLKNVHFIFSGSKRHVMADMFTNERSPFYESTSMFPIDKIPEETYSDYIISQFRNNGKAIEDQAVSFILEWTRRHTFYTQFLCNRVFQESRDMIGMTDVFAAIDTILKENGDAFLERRTMFTKRQWEYMIAIAKEGEVTKPTSSEFLQKYNLGAASSSSRTLDSLVEKEQILEIKTACENKYSVYNVFFSRWLERL